MTTVEVIVAEPAIASGADRLQPLGGYAGSGERFGRREDPGGFRMSSHGSDIGGERELSRRRPDILIYVMTATRSVSGAYLEVG